MREILISFSVFILCAIIAVASQVISPTKVLAENPSPTFSTESILNSSAKTISNVFELDPEDPNPTLFAMAVENSAKNEASPLGDPIEFKKPRITESGLSITDIEVGDGPEAMPGQKVSVNYVGRLENGEEFDSSYGRGPFSFPLGAGQVIKGWDEGVAGMRVGGKRKLVIPPELGYGSRGAGRVIPPNATLVFEVELLAIN